jgi:hypothetical protein
MDDLMHGKDAEYVASVKTSVIARAERVLRTKYAAVAMYGTMAIALLLFSVFAAYRAFLSVFRYNMDVQSRRPLTGGDNVNDPGDDNETRAEMRDSDVRRAPSGNQIRNRLGSYSKAAGRDLKSDLRDENDDYPDPPRRKGDEEDDDDA